MGNVYACVAWAGWAHFLYAFRGQGKAISRLGVKSASRLTGYVGVVALTIAALVAARWAVGPALFSAVVWVYFIDHFIKAEQTFDGRAEQHRNSLHRWLSSYQPLLTFGWLSLVLLDVELVNANPWVLWIVSMLLGAIVLVFGGWKKMATGRARGPLLSLFFIAEALVWGTYSNYGGPMFLFGVYVFHIAAGSYVHYLGSYFYAHSKGQARDTFSSPVSILALNILLIMIGVAVMNSPALDWLRPVFGIEWFTLWVGVHLVASDLFPLFKQVPRHAAAT